MELSVAFQSIYRPRNLRSCSPSTLNLWRVSLRHFNTFLGRSATIDDLTDDNLSQFATYRRADVAPATVNKDLASLLALWRYLHRRQIVTRYPDVSLEPEPFRVPIAFTEDEINRLLRSARRARGFVGEVLASSWFPALILVAFDTGERIGGLLGLRWTDVDLPGRWLIFRAEHRKGGRADKPSRIAEDTATALERLPRVSRDVFHWAGSKCGLWKRYGKILRRAGLPDDRLHKFHCLRRSTASHLEAAGGNATAALGHASRRNTLRYLDPRIATPPQAVDLLWRPAP